MSIEEQFYFVFPVLLLVILKIPLLRKNILNVLGVMIVVSLLSAFIDLKKVGIFWESYYMPQIRAGEMLIGSYLAIYSVKETEPKKYFPIISGFALMALLITLFLDGVFIPPLFPGILAFIPCVATAVLIYANEKKHYISNFLSYKPIVWVGKLSYSLYLWHWVVLAIIRYTTQSNEIDLTWGFIAVVLILVLSIFTYYFIENPLRKTSLLSFGKSFAYFYVIPSIVVFGMAYLVKNIPFISFPQELQYPTDICHNNLDGDCIKGDRSKEPKILMIGNSFVGHLNPFIDKVGKKEGWSATVVSANVHPFVFNKEIYNKKRKDFKACLNRDKFFNDNYQKYSIIIFHYNVINNEYDYYLVETWKRLINEGKKVYVITSVVEADFTPLKQYHNSLKNLPIRELKKNSQGDILSFVPKDLPIRRVDLRGYIPDDFHIDGKPIYMDRLHWNVYGAEKIADKFLENNRLIKVEDLE